MPLQISEEKHFLKMRFATQKRTHALNSMAGIAEGDAPIRRTNGVVEAH